MAKFDQKYLSYEEALEKLRHYCSFQDRCHQEVWQKLKSLNFNQERGDELILQLMQEQYLDEERFARNYVRGKFRHNEWGRIKIIQGLRQKGIHQNLIDLALEEIDEQDYRGILQKHLEKKWHTLKREHGTKKRSKVARYLIQKGFEPELVWQCLDDQDEKS